MELTTIYLFFALALVGMFAIRAPHEDIRTVFALAIVWPLSMLAILFMVLMSTTGWNLDAAKGTKMFGFRRPTNDMIKGFAVSIFYGEVQFWKKK